MRYTRFTFLIYFFSTALFSNLVFGDTKLLGTEKKWNAYTTKISKNKTCFITSEPVKTKGKFNKKNRGKPYVFVTNTKGGSYHEVSIKAGFNFKKNKDVIFDVDGKKTKLFPVDDRAWSESSKIDRFLVQSMRRGKTLTITGTSTPGHKRVATYSLAGWTTGGGVVDQRWS